MRFYRNLLQDMKKGALVYDVGANDGSKTDILLRLGAKVVAVEPDAHNQAVIKRRFLRYRVVKKPVIVIGKALSDQNAMETMWVDGDGSALNTLSQKWVNSLQSDQTRFGHTVAFKEKREVHTTTLADLFAAYGVPFFVKIDVEGYEQSVLRGLKQPVQFLQFEVNLPEFKAEALECVSILRELAEHGRFNYLQNFQTGLALRTWVAAKEFVSMVHKFDNRSVEVFWRTDAAVTA